MNGADPASPAWKGGGGSSSLHEGCCNMSRDVNKREKAHFLSFLLAYRRYARCGCGVYPPYLKNRKQNKERQELNTKHV